MVTALVSRIIGRLGRLIPVTSDNSIVLFQFDHHRHKGVVDYLLCWDPAVYTRTNGTNPSCPQLEFALESPNTLSDFITATLIRQDKQPLVLDGCSELVIVQVGFFLGKEEKRR